MDTFPLGGISKSLLALFNELDDKYSVDLLLMKHEGIFIPLIPDNVNLLPEPIETEFRNPHPKNVFSYAKSLPFNRWIKWCKYSAACTFGKLTGGLHRQVQTMDSWLGKNTAPLQDTYDAAIAYQGGRCIYYLVENIQARIKIGYVHSDYINNVTDYMLYPTDKKYFPKLNYIVTISDRCADSLKTVFPDITGKIKVIENICSTSFIRNMAGQYVDFDNAYRGIRLVTMGRLDWYVKGLDFIIESARILKNRNIDFRWYLLGDGNDRNKVETAAREADISDRIYVLGAKTNPYPYLLKCDIYVHPSRVEGKSVALDEVKALAKPIVVTNFSTVNDQFTNNVNAVICGMEPTEIADSIQALINDTDTRNRLIENLKTEKTGNEEQALIFQSLLNG